MTCIGNDPACPCQDGLVCHYRDIPGSPGWPVPNAIWTEGVCGDGAAILRDGVRVPIAELLAILNERASEAPVGVEWTAAAGSYVMALCGNCSGGPPCRCSRDPAIVSRVWSNGKWVWIATFTADAGAT